MARRRQEPWTEQQYGPNRYAWLSIIWTRVCRYSGVISDWDVMVFATAMRSILTRPD